MEMNDDWDLDYFFNTRLGLMDVPDETFLYFLEQYISPTITRRRRNGDLEWETIPQKDIVSTINMSAALMSILLNPLRKPVFTAFFGILPLHTPSRAA